MWTGHVSSRCLETGVSKSHELGMCLLQSAKARAGEWHGAPGRSRSFILSGWEDVEGVESEIMTR